LQFGRPPAISIKFFYRDRGRWDLMRFLPFRALLVLVVLPPVMYLLAIQGAESVLTGHYLKILERYVPGDPQPLLTGRTALEDALQENIGRLYQEDPLLSRGVFLTVVVKTSTGRRIYPPVYLGPETDLADRSPVEVASWNYALLDEGLVVAARVNINQNTLVANAILAGCLMVALAGLGALYRRGTRRQAKEEAKHALEIEHWRSREEAQRNMLASMKTDNAGLLKQIDKIKSEMERERSAANRNEEELFDEMAQLEAQLQDYLTQQKEQAVLIADLEDQLERFNRVRQQQSAHQSRTADAWRKRFASLYKDTVVADRAVKGFANLSEALQIKAEEVIHQLNADPEVVAVKRKLFQPKGRETVFEIVFARKGRLYFRRNKNRQVEVLAIGTKNDQGRDLGFLNRRGAEIER
jgi:hypothetical protein